MKKFQRLAMLDSQHTTVINSTSHQPSLEESFTLISILQRPQKSRTVRIPIEIGSVPLALPLRGVLFGTSTRVQ